MKEKIKLLLEKGRKMLRAFHQDSRGIGTVEVILILVVLIGLVLIFKTQITKVVNNVFKQINSSISSVY